MHNAELSALLNDDKAAMALWLRAFGNEREVPYRKFAAAFYAALQLDLTGPNAAAELNNIDDHIRALVDPDETQNATAESFGRLLRAFGPMPSVELLASALAAGDLNSSVTSLEEDLGLPTDGDEAANSFYASFSRTRSGSAASTAQPPSLSTTSRMWLEDICYTIRQPWFFGNLSADEVRSAASVRACREQRDSLRARAGDQSAARPGCGDVSRAL